MQAPDSLKLVRGVCPSAALLLYEHAAGCVARLDLIIRMQRDMQHEGTFSSTRSGLNVRARIMRHFMTWNVKTVFPSM